MSAGKKVIAVLFTAVVVVAIFLSYRAWQEKQWRDRFKRGHLLYEDENCAEAAADLLAVYKQRPETEQGREAFYLYCLCLESMGEKDRALKGWEQIVADPLAEEYHPRAILSLAKGAMGKNRPADASSYIKRLIKDHPDSPLVGDAYFLLSEKLQGEGNLMGAMEAAQKVVDDYPESDMVGRAQKEVGDLYIKLLFSRKIIPGTEEYVVQSGDSLGSIANKFGTTIELLKEMNEQTIKGESIRPNDRLKVCTAKFSILVDKSANTFILKRGEFIVKIYPAGTGKEGTTPIGEFKIVNKVKNPEWFKAGTGVIPYGDPENLLGTRWMGFDSPGYGIHGTWEPGTVGKQASAGCIRLLNEDVEEIFKIVPMGTKVTVID